MSPVIRMRDGSVKHASRSWNRRTLYAQPSCLREHSAFSGASCRADGPQLGERLACLRGVERPQRTADVVPACCIDQAKRTAPLRPATRLPARRRRDVQVVAKPRSSTSVVTSNAWRLIGSGFDRPSLGGRRGSGRGRRPPRDSHCRRSTPLIPAPRRESQRPPM